MKTEKPLRKVAIMSLKNAEQFIKDAEFLVKKRSYGHAFALSVLAEEELAKAVMYYLCAEGIFGINGKWRNDSIRHVRKQGFAFGIAFMYELILMIEEAMDFARRKARRDATKFKVIFEKKIAEILQKEMKLFASKRGDLYDHLKPFEKIQEKRERALYVEAKLQKGEITSPRDFKKSEAKQYISHVKERLEVLKDEINGKMKDQDKHVAMSLIKMSLNQCTDERKKKMLEWYGLPEKQFDAF